MMQQSYTWRPPDELSPCCCLGVIQARLLLQHLRQHWRASMMVCHTSCASSFTIGQGALAGLAGSRLRCRAPLTSKTA